MQADLEDSTQLLTVIFSAYPVLFPDAGIFQAGSVGEGWSLKPVTIMASSPAMILQSDIRTFREFVQWIPSLFGISGLLRIVIPCTLASSQSPILTVHSCLL